MFLIWIRGEEKLASFLEHINSYHQIIKLTTEMSQDGIRYLDV